VPNAMDAPTAATQPVQTLDVSVESYGDEDDVDGAVEPWGRLFPLGKAYYPVGMCFSREFRGLLY